MELAVVLAVIWAPLFAAGICDRIHPLDWTLETELYTLVLLIGETCLLLYIVWNRNGTLRPLGIRKTRWWAEVLWGVGIFLALRAAGWYLWALFKIFGWVEDAEETGRPEGLYAALLPLFLLAGAVFEELLVRGYLWDRLSRLTGRRTLALFLSSALFAAYHPYSLAECAIIFVDGLLLGTFFWMSRSLPRVVLGHWALNLWLYFA